MADIEKIADNRRAQHEYIILDTYEAGIILEGMEAKSLREGKASLQDSYARVENGEVFLYDAHISLYSHSETKKYDPKRKRKLLLNKAEIRRLYKRTQQSGFTLIPLNMYFSEKGYAKLSLSVAKGKHTYDKREDMKKNELKRELASAMKDRKIS